MSEEIVSNKKNHDLPSVDHQEEEENEMTFWDHLEELRWHLTRSLIAVLVLSIVAFVNRSFVFDVIVLAPKSSDFITNQLLCQFSEWINYNFLCMEDRDLSIINFNLSGQFLTHMYISFMFGLMGAIPYVFWEAWRFIQPALYDNEKKHSGGAVVVTSLLFIMGALFSYFIIVPLAINFLGSYKVSEEIANTISLSSYISTVLTLTFALGIIFELPVIMYFLAKVGVVTSDYLKRNRKYMIIIALVLSAIITPADIFSQVMVAIPLVVLYEISISVTKKVEKRKLQAEESE